MPVTTLRLASKLGDYDVHITPDAGFVAQLAARPSRVFVVDETVWELHRDGALSALDPAEVVLLPISEERKNLDTVQEIYDALMERGTRRNTTFVSIGGGITQDLTGFAASSLYRGIPWVFVPTTLLAQADSCIGSKTSLNYGRYKNLLGTFYPPREVWLHLPFLDTLAEPDYYSGLGEVVKLHLMGGEELAARAMDGAGAWTARDHAAMAEAVEACLRLKRDYIESDEFDTGRRNLLNYGHCFGHAIESATGFAIAHGTGVVLGMMIAADVAVRRGLLDDTTRRRLYERLWVPTLGGVSLAGLDVDGVVEAMGRDKKRTGEGLVLVMLADGFEMLKVDDLTVDEAREALETFLAEEERGWTSA